MSPEDEQRLRALQELIVRIAAGDYAARGELSSARDEVDATIVAVNTLAEDTEAAHRAAERGRGPAARRA